jgi:orotate phosphoribosyltransferase-like protein
MDIPTIEERQDRLGDDLVWGANGIADELNVSIHRARYLIRKKLLPVTWISERHIVASRRALRKAFKSIAA